MKAKVMKMNKLKPDLSKSLSSSNSVSASTSAFSTIILQDFLGLLDIEHYCRYVICFNNKNGKIAPSCDSCWNILSFLFYTLNYMQCIICILFNVQYFIHCVFCIAFYAKYSSQSILYIVFYALYSLHCIICIVFYALYYLHYIICIICHNQYGEIQGRVQSVSVKIGG